ncbi:hypothetical protein NMG60_11003622 [Bertholletia excelsa]
MLRLTNVLQKSRKALEDFDLLKVLQAEIRHELSSNPFPDSQCSSLGEFSLDYDSKKSQDVVFRKKCESGEEVAVSALLSPLAIEGDSSFPREAQMKVCIKKPGMSSILQFDCGVTPIGDYGSELSIQNACYIPSANSLAFSMYKGPSFSSLDPDLQHELTKYLVSKGIKQSFTNFLLHHLHLKEQGQYVNWLQRLEAIVSSED